MPNVKYYLKDFNSDINTLIILKYRYQGKTFTYSSGLKIHPDNWLKDSQKCREGKIFKMGYDYNYRLKKMGSYLEESYYQLLNEGKVVTNRALKFLMDKHLDKLEKKDIIPKLVDFFSTYKDRMIAIHGYEYAKKYQTVYNTLVSYFNDNRVLNYDEIDMQFYDNYKDYLLYTKQYSVNYAGLHFKIIKEIMAKATDLRYNINMDFLKFKVIREDVDKIYLTNDEVLQLYRVQKDLKGNGLAKSRIRARDMFIIGCVTGLRFSDFSQIIPQHFNKDYTKLAITNQKTGIKTVIPVHWMLKEILEKYDYKLPRAISNQKMNDYIKDACKAAKIKDIIVVTRKKGKKIIRETKEKHELVSTHTARRSFATNAYLARIPTASIMKITGHKSEKTFFSYIKISEEENAELLINHPFFSEKYESKNCEN